MGKLTSKIAGAVMGAVIGGTSAVAASDVIPRDDLLKLDPEDRFKPYMEDGNPWTADRTLEEVPGYDVLANSFNGVCSKGHLNPQVAALIQGQPDIAEPISKALIVVTNGEQSMPLDDDKMPYTSSVVKGFVVELNELLRKNEGFQSYVKQLADQPNADPYIRANTVTGALEFGCRQGRQIAGLAEDTINAADRKAIAREVGPLIEDALKASKLPNGPNWKSPSPGQP